MDETTVLEATTEETTVITTTTAIETTTTEEVETKIEAEEYQAMYEDIDDILNTIHQCGEAVFTRAIETEPVIPQEEFESYTLHIDNPELFIYDAPGYDANIVGKITDQKSYTIVEEYVEEEDGYITYTWGKLKSGAGWINLYDAISY